MTAEPVEQAPKLAAGECGLYLACDALVGADAANLGVADPAKARALAELPDLVRGYEDVKLANVAQYRQRQAEVLTPAGS